MGIVNVSDVTLKGSGRQGGAIVQYILEAPKLTDKQALIIDVPEEFSANPGAFRNKIGMSLRHLAAKHNLPANTFSSRLTTENQVAVMRRPGATNGNGHATPAPKATAAPKPPTKK